MPKPPSAGPHSDITGVNRDARVNAPARGSAQGDAGDKQAAAEGSAARPDETPPLGAGDNATPSTAK